MMGPTRACRAGLAAVAAVMIAAACAQDSSTRASRRTKAPPPVPDTAEVSPAPVKTPGERAIEDAMRLAPSNPLGAAKLAEAALRKLPRKDPAAPRLHFIAGRSRLEHEQQLYSIGGSSPENFRKRRNELAAEARTNPGQYRRNEPAGTWVYNGWHFRTIVSQWPQDPLADDAGYELTKLTFAGECEGDIACYVNAEVAPLIEFLRAFPQSEFAESAVSRANSAFNNNLYIRGRSQPVPIADLRSRAPGYTPADLRRLLERYTAAAGTLPPRVRARAYETLGDLWGRFGQKKKALELYQYIVRNVPDYPNLDEIGRRMRALG